MKDSINRTAVCPKCGAIYNERPAISREDNTTEICPDCGTREALMTLGISQEEQEQILRAIHGSQVRFQ
jgi:DNA-directed RNA polymerase subunit RPC12/RpoP